MAQVFGINFKKDVWSVGEVFSKCVILPKEKGQRITNPLPDEILRSSDKVAAWNAIFEKDEVLVWNVCSMLLPEDDVLENMCKNLPIEFPVYPWDTVVNDIDESDGDESSSSFVDCSSADESGD